MSEGKKDTHSKRSKRQNLESSEEFSEYVHAVSIPMKVAMAAIAIFFLGVILYCAFGTVPVTITVAAKADSSGTTVCYVKEDERDDIEPGDEVTIGDTTAKVSAVSSASTTVDETYDKYACSLGGFEVGDNVYLVTLDCNLAQGVYSAVLTKSYLQPLEVMLAG